MSWSTRAHPETQLDEDMRLLARNVELYADATGDRPISTQKLVDPEEGMHKLASKLPVDPWGHPYRPDEVRPGLPDHLRRPDLEAGTADNVTISGTWVPKEP